MSDETRFEQALEKVLADRSPKDDLTELAPEEQRMVEMAQLLRGSVGGVPNPMFRERLRRDVLGRRGVSRRAAILSSLGTLAAGLAVGLGLNRVFNWGTGSRSPAAAGPAGRWVAIAQVHDVPEGTIRTFKADAVQGFLVHRNGEFRALSRSCTHMGCTLNYQKVDRSFVCPCHGAEFDLTGQMVNGPGGYYSQSLRSLAKLQVRVKNDAVEVWSA